MSSTPSAPVVVRSPVPQLAGYAGYREYLRFDFWYSCAYCSISEAEAQAIGFEIDHFEPQTVCQGNAHAYSNLMWACTVCNGHKSDIWPTAVQFENGYRFVRPDQEDPSDHFEMMAFRLAPKTAAGEWTLEVLFLNRQLLKRLRAVRSRIMSSQKSIAHGLQVLRSVNLDKFKQDGRARFLEARASVAEQVRHLTVEDAAQVVVRVMNHSPFLDPDPEVRVRTKRRREYLSGLDAQLVSDVQVEDE